MSSIKAKEIHERFFEMEQKYKLFDLRTHDGLPVWDIARYIIYYYLVFNNTDPNIGKTRLSNKIQIILSKVYAGARSLVSFPKIFFGKQENFQFGASRTKNGLGKFYDQYFDSVKITVPGKFILYESVIYKNSYSNDNRIFDILPLIKVFQRFLFSRKRLNNYDLAFKAISETFGRQVIDNKEINQMLNDFRIEYRFYKWLFKLKKIKRIFVTQNGIQKALFKAAKDCDIVSFEFQHGDIVDATVLYNYETEKVNIKDNLIYPDFLLTFSDLWTQGKYIPSKCIEIGTNFFDHKTFDVRNSKNTLVVITSFEQNLELQKITFNLAKANPDIIIYYKLHPAQFHLASQQREYFKDLKNIQVVSNEKNMRDMLMLSNEFLAIYSTAIYEVIQSGKTIFILKELNYSAFKPYFNLPNVHLVSDENDIVAVRKEPSFSNFYSKPPQFFKPLNPTNIIALGKLTSKY